MTLQFSSSFDLAYKVGTRVTGKQEKDRQNYGQINKRRKDRNADYDATIDDTDTPNSYIGEATSMREKAKMRMMMMKVKMSLATS